LVPNSKLINAVYSSVAIINGGSWLLFSLSSGNCVLYL
jgi:hypothetical protein